MNLLMKIDFYDFQVQLFLRTKNYDATDTGNVNEIKKIKSRMRSLHVACGQMLENPLNNIQKCRLIHYHCMTSSIYNELQPFLSLLPRYWNFSQKTFFRESQHN